jgi:hypothetical protein
MAHQFYDNTQEKFHDQLQERLLDCARVWAIWNLSSLPSIYTDGIPANEWG